MNLRLFPAKYLICLLTILTGLQGSAQLYDRMTWSRDGNSFYASEEGAILKFNLTEGGQNVLVRPQQLIPPGEKQATRD